ncbi:MAG: hypothetical protein KAT15_13775 [Bacteroidales bacterium]|nr:hypothetical protein [Bacteroidales bacterium]
MKLLIFAIVCQAGYTQSTTTPNPSQPEASPIISGLHTLSIHVRDTLTHDSVYQFLIHQLGLPVYYTPVMYGEKKYAGIYAGNMVLEPCGPYPNIKYATEGFRSIFFGMNFEVHHSLASSREALDRLGMMYQDNRNSIYIRDSILCSENVFAAIYEVRDEERRDSLRNMLITNKKYNPGIEYIKEIRMDYKDESNLQRWKEFLYPLEFVESHTCQVNDSLQIHFTLGKINQVKGITFKVESLERATRYFAETDLLESDPDQGILINQKQAFGLLIYLSENR